MILNSNKMFSLATLSNTTEPLPPTLKAFLNIDKGKWHNQDLNLLAFLL